MISNLVGARIRAVRGQRKKTQQQLADLAGIPRATLATVERDDANPSLAVVFKIATALGMGIDELVETPQRFIKYVPATAMRQQGAVDGAYQATTVSPGGFFHITQTVFFLRGGGLYQGAPHPPGSEEYIHVLQGEIDLEVSGERVPLKVGDTAFFYGNVRHSYRNPGQEDGRAMVTILKGCRKDNLDPFSESLDMRPDRG